MSDANVIIFFDMAWEGRGHKSSSPNTWKTRYSLNYKGLPYRTEWVEHPDIPSISNKYGVPPTSTNPDGSLHYTLPMIYDPSTRTAVADSLAIARYLDETYPSTPALFPPGTAALQAAVLDTLFPSVGVPLFMNIAPRIWAALTPRGQVNFRKTREKTFGKKLEELAVGEDVQKNWKAMEEGLRKIAEWLGTNGEGKDMLFLGDHVSFADIQLVSILTWAKTICGEDSEDWRRIAGWHDDKWGRMLDYFDQYATTPVDLSGDE